MICGLNFLCNFFEFSIDFSILQEYNCKKSVLKVKDMNSAHLNASEYFFNFSVAFYFSYAYFALKKLPVRAQ